MSLRRKELPQMRFAEVIAMQFNLDEELFSYRSRTPQIVASQRAVFLTAGTLWHRRARRFAAN
jgi:hypothetical protein